jgi:hypothetical protein
MGGTGKPDTVERRPRQRLIVDGSKSRTQGNDSPSDRVNNPLDNHLSSRLDRRNATGCIVRY